MKSCIRGAAVVAVASMVLGLSACGGGGGGGGGGGTTNFVSSSVPDGLFSGSISGSATSTHFELLALDNSEIWALYGTMAGAAFQVKGFVQGTITRSGNNFASTTIKDFGFVPAAAASTSGTLTDDAVSGTLTSNAVTVTFSGTPPATSTYNYDTPASLSQITGNWTLRDLNGTITTLTINANGSFTGDSAGCSLTGTFTPRPSGKNVFNMTATYGPAPCPLPGTVASGIAVTYPLTAALRELVVGGVNAGRTAGNAFFGTR